MMASAGACRCFLGPSRTVLRAANLHEHTCTRAFGWRWMRCRAVYLAPGFNLSNDEERQLKFVACTRARDVLTVYS